MAVVVSRRLKCVGMHRTIGWRERLRSVFSVAVAVVVFVLIVVAAGGGIAKQERQRNRNFLCLPGL